MTSALRVVASCCLLLVGAGCSFVDPQVGLSQVSCGIGTGGASQSGPAYYGTSPSQTTSTPTCQTSSASSCDDCEATHCCATRSACYGDPVCACADLNLDECLDAAAGQPAQISRCWSIFAGKGTTEQARSSCERAWCQAACSIL
jgi:hypothetical protein